MADRGAGKARVGTSDDLERYRLLAEVRASWDSFDDGTLTTQTGESREVLTHLAAYGRRADWMVFRLIPQLGPAERWFDSLWTLYDAMTAWAERTGMLVADARAKGATWDEIGHALGIDAESAYRRLYWLSERAGGMRPGTGKV